MFRGLASVTLRGAFVTVAEDVLGQQRGRCEARCISCYRSPHVAGIWQKSAPSLPALRNATLHTCPPPPLLLVHRPFQFFFFGLNHLIDCTYTQLNLFFSPFFTPRLANLPFSLPTTCPISFRFYISTQADAQHGLYWEKLTTNLVSSAHITVHSSTRMPWSMLVYLKEERQRDKKKYLQPLPLMRYLQVIL